MLLSSALFLAQVSTKADLALPGLAAPLALRVEQFALTRPLYAGLRLILEEADKPSIVVKKPADLEEKVRIASAGQALDYVRLLRMPGVWPLLFSKPVLEIRRGPILYPAPKFLYSDLRTLTISGWDGVLSEADWIRLHLGEPVVTGGNGKDWSVRRPCLTREGDKYQTGILVERLSETGRYVSSVERLEDAPRGVRWNVTIPANR